MTSRFAAAGSAHAPCQSPKTFFLLYTTIGEKRKVTRGEGGRSEENDRRSEKQTAYAATSVGQNTTAAGHDRTERTDSHRRDLVPSERIAPRTNGQMTAAEKRRLITIERLTAASGTRAEVTEPLRARHTRGRRCSRRRHVAVPRPAARANR